MATDDPDPGDARARVIARLAALQRLKLQLESSSRLEMAKTIEQMMQAEMEALRKLRDRDEEAA